MPPVIVELLQTPAHEVGNIVIDYDRRHEEQSDENVDILTAKVGNRHISITKTIDQGNYSDIYDVIIDGSLISVDELTGSELWEYFEDTFRARKIQKEGLSA